MALDEKDSTTATNTGPTPGPWTVSRVETEHGAICYIKADTGHREVAVLYTDGEQDANARLIASAPDLLDALRAFCGDYEATPTTNDVSLKAAYRHALDVIAKAEGR